MTAATQNDAKADDNYIANIIYLLMPKVQVHSMLFVVNCMYN